MNKVILVDDHYIVRQGLRFLLSTIENIEVLQDFADGETFLEYLKEHEHPDIVLLDLVMPGMNGIEITEYIKAHYPDIKVLVLTSYVDDEHVISAINKGADGYEMKDVEPQQLIETRNGYILQSNKVSNIYRVLNPDNQPIFGTSKMREAETYFNRNAKEELVHI